MSNFHRGIAWGFVISAPIDAWIILIAYFIGRAAS